MKKKNIIIIVVSVLIIGLVVGAILLAVEALDNADKAKKEREKEEKEILDSFQPFRDAVEGFYIELTTYREIIKSDINENTVYQYDSWILSLDNYTKALDEVDSKAEVFKKRCINNYYAKENVERKCVSFKDAYEKAVNSYVEDINDFNEKIKGINEKSKKDLKEYELKYEKVDIDNDKEYSVIEMENDEDNENNDTKNK